jgi:hypothetical protein
MMLQIPSTCCAASCRHETGNGFTDPRRKNYICIYNDATKICRLVKLSTRIFIDPNSPPQALGSSQRPDLSPWLD